MVTMNELQSFSRVPEFLFVDRRILQDIYNSCVPQVSILLSGQKPFFTKWHMTAGWRFARKQLNASERSKLRSDSLL